ncbi:MAG TPA: UTP--glucose-1-phosphate uridylyltransferase [bacterium]|jgi:UTP--glucose-1-phosphate uridylyltransferase|nr:UTP--glucose-1-phosphate uridylyltransferase [bacterium]HNZ51234.1 UTP--glucose-1-phosphate uridylyltransferase [bacterium]HOF79717.1 UTP--glucose-1-phosphate uridylyltransferase [bacterium]HOH85129.1 UTP--glucose-1-phosphate uridylyltransferase [bacterium]HOQ91694.1 UTP--glucose-1-phosphate uridylyltransferase [bacterium]
MRKITKAILPVAGFGTRFLPATKAQPKEMLPVVDKPAIQYLVEDAVAAGIEEIIFVTGRGKRAIEDHFDYSFELDKTLVEKHKLDLVKQVRRISEMAKFSYVRQPLPLGDGHALACAAHLVYDEPVLVMFGDTLYDADEGPASQVLKTFDKYGDPVIGLSAVDRQEVSKFGVIDGLALADNVYEIKQFIEKPSPQEAPSNLVAVGIYVITPDVLHTLTMMKPRPNGELRLADAFVQMLAADRPLYGQELIGTWLDTGDKLSMIKANIQLGLKNKEIGADLRRFIEGILR